MNLYLKWYYWYKNFGDELLLFWVLRYLTKTYKPKKIYIEAQDVNWLQNRLDLHQKTLLDAHIVYQPVEKKSHLFLSIDLVVFGWWESISDARPFPYNGWTYVFWFFFTILSWKYIILGWVGTRKSFWSRCLYWLFLTKAQHILVRDKQSYNNAVRYNQKITLHHDFAYDVLPLFIHNQPKKQHNQNILIINANPYIWSEKVKQYIIDYAQNHPDYDYVYLPAEWVDTQYYYLLKKSLPTLRLYDWTAYNLLETVRFVLQASSGIAARLHVLILLDYAGVPYTPLVYQEKITHILWVSNDLRKL